MAKHLEPYWTRDGDDPGRVEDRELPDDCGWLDEIEAEEDDETKARTA